MTEKRIETTQFYGGMNWDSTRFKVIASIVEQQMEEKCTNDTETLIVLGCRLPNRV